MADQTTETSTVAEIEMTAVEKPDASVSEKDASGLSQDVPPSDVVTETPRFAEVAETPSNGEPRDHWTFNWEFIAAAVAFNVDSTLITRMSYGSAYNGGVLFWVLYAIFLLLIGVPMFYMELCLGQFFGKGPFHIWNFCPLFRGVGVVMVVAIAFVIPYYSSILSIVVFYLFNSFSSTLPWASCENAWNTDRCQEGPLFYNYTYDSASPAKEYFEYRVLQISDGIHHLGSVQWELMGCAFAVTVLMFVVLFGGVKVIGKVVSVTLLLKYIAIFVLLVRALTLPGAGSGLKFYLYPSYAVFNAHAWTEAFKLALISTGVGLGAIHTLASYKNFKSPALRDSFLACLITAGTCFVTGLLYHAIFGAISHLKGVPMITHSMFPAMQSMSELFAKLPVGPFWSFLFFFMLLLAGLSTQFLGVEILITAIADILPRRSKLLRLFITTGVCGAAFIASLIFLTKGGVYLFILSDNHVMLLAFFVIIILQCITVGWIYGIDQFSNDIQMMTGIRPPIIFKFIWCFVIPFFTLLSFAHQLLSYYPLTAWSYVYPVWAIVIGWIISLAPLVPLPVFFLMAIASPGKSLSSNPNWGPADPNYQTEYSNQIRRTRTMKDRLMAIFRT